ncbi:MAG TPA: hypothetical protein VIJ51_12225 [Solirubrobacteraceae bacterium]
MLAAPSGARAALTATLTPSAASGAAPAGDPLAVRQATVSFDPIAGQISVSVVIAGTLPQPGNPADLIGITVEQQSECGIPSLASRGDTNITLADYPSFSASAEVQGGEGLRLDELSPAVSADGHTLSVTVTDPFLMGSPLGCVSVSSGYGVPDPNTGAPEQIQGLGPVMFSSPPATSGGKPPTVQVSRDALSDDLMFEFPEIALNSCANYADGPILLTITDSQARTTALSRQCGGSWSPAALDGSGWTLDTSPDSGDAGPAATFSPQYLSDGTRHLSYKVVWSGQTLSAGAFTVDTTVVPSSRVYQGTDDFVNYCIDQIQTVYSSDGRLYCIQPGGIFYDVENSGPAESKLPTLTAQAAKNYTTVALKRKLGSVAAAHITCRSTSRSRQTCQVRFKDRTTAWSGTSAIFYSKLTVGTAWNYTLNLRGYPHGCRRKSCSHTLVVT